ncbi:prephenate dehydrogenase [Candidatus Desantisbacteria bacterium CG23_combo_of_CG06-09_8_20_14_all_40_23]|uniref:Prephenate dehydrogenase n=1 Tax=Candidatus Desantisbacteria bacterium CG23_combo_of_CG06-09_8_20_14_all_40_23 TaxID=1974550 RepID=A0A2H0A3J2_9BACT|nr:MAG: prephenate dehydrogenase [Candidatus Desantisbacteria bacterium CG23_combo_of_CG06-09_8_20_14_all_40_23]
MMNIETVTIIGVGLIGGSLAITLKERCGVKRIIGVGRSLSSLEQMALIVDSHGHKVIDESTLDPKYGVRNADVVILALPVVSIIEVGKEIVANLKIGCIVIDVGSTKAEIVHILTPLVQQKGSFVGTHPLAGSHNRGTESAKGDLFHNAVCVITPVEKTDKDACEIIKAMWTRVGAKIMEMPPEGHDKLIAITSHLPHIIASVLVNIAMGEGEKIIPLIASGFLDTTRVAQGDAEMWKDICLTNQGSIKEMLGKFKDALNKWEQVISDERWDRLKEMFEAAQGWRKGV